MHSLITLAGDTVAQHPHLALLIAFAGAVIEAVAVLGVIFPGTPMLMAVAGAASVAGMPMWPILLVAVAGAVIGDGVSFWIGRRYGARIRTAWPIRSYPTLMTNAEAFFRRFGVVSVGLARFVPVIRSTVPLVAGMTGMPTRRFLIANVLSALVWAPAHVLPAKLAGVAILQLEAGGWWLPAGIGVLLLGVLVAAVALHRLGRPPRVTIVGKRHSSLRP